LVYIAGFPLLTGWIIYSIGLYIFAGCCWVPVVWLQLRMRAIARAADSTAAALPMQYWSYARTWFWLGIPAFSALVAVYWLMTCKPNI
jgi:uncharacterized membrane protein